jgi:hypothetical protein
LAILATVQGVVGRRQQRAQGKGFLQEHSLSIKDSVVIDQIIGIASHIGNLELWLHGHQSLRQFAAAHPRHNNISQKQVNASPVAFGKRQCSGSIPCVEYGVSITLKASTD